MKHLVDIAIYIVTHSKETTDPMSVATRVARELRMLSLDTESLLTAIYAVDHFGVDDALAKQVDQEIRKSDVYEQLNKIL